MGIASYTFGELAEGTAASFTTVVTDDAIDRFAELSGDVSTLHMDAKFAVSRGFQGRVVHGAYLASLVSRLVGTELPGLNALVHQVQLSFHSPAYVGDTVTVSGRIDRKVDSVRSLVMAVHIEGTGPTGAGRKLATGKVQIGFTD